MSPWLLSNNGHFHPVSFGQNKPETIFRSHSLQKRMLFRLEKLIYKKHKNMEIF